MSLTSAKGYLLDTNISSEATKAKPSSVLAEFLADIDLRDRFISAISIGEISRGIAIAPAEKRVPLSAWLRRDIYQRHAGRILPLDEHVMDPWGKMIAVTGKRLGQLPVFDGLIAATALHYRLTGVPRNSTDFALFGVPQINPFETPL